MKRLLIVVVIVGGCGSNGGSSGGMVGVVTPADAARACISAAACGFQLPVGDARLVGATGCAFGNLNVDNPLVAPGIKVVGAREVECLAKAGGDCNAVVSCFNAGQGVDPCSAADHCEGTVLHACWTGHETQYDCAADGKTCYDGAYLRCVDGTCSGNYLQCDGNVSNDCENSVLFVRDCTAENGTCATSGVTVCVPNGPTCTILNTEPWHADGLRCEGNTLVTCNGNEVPLDCSKLGLSCFPVMDTTLDHQPIQVARCQAGVECDPFATPATCNGTVLSFCNTGIATTIDCAALGFKGCVADQGGGCTM